MVLLKCLQIEQREIQQTEKFNALQTLSVESRLKWNFHSDWLRMKERKARDKGEQIV